MLFLIPFALLIFLIVYVLYVVVVNKIDLSRRTKQILSIAPVLIMAAGMLMCGLFFGIDVIGTRRENKQFIHNFEQIPHPNGSELVASESRRGLLIGNSNHCDFFVGQIRRSQFTHQEIKDFYQGKTIPPASDRENSTGHYGDDLDVAINVIFVEEGAFAQPDYMPYSLRKVSDWGVDLANYQGGGLYVVFAFDIGYTPGTWDIECH